MAPKKRNRSEEQTELEEDLADLTLVSEAGPSKINDTWPHFLVIESNDQNRPVTSLSPFVIDKTIKACAGSVKQVKKLRSGVLLIEVDNKKHAENLLKLKLILDLSVSVSAHRTLNTCKGVVRSYDLAKNDEAESLRELNSQGVTELRPIHFNKNGKKERSNTTIITFSLPSVPQYLTMGYLKVKVEKYYPTPLRCFNCQRFGHHRAACKHEAVCALCGMTSHGDSACTTPKSCINCKGNHAAYEKACPRWQNETAIVKEKTAKNVSFEEARKLVEARSAPAPSITYSAVVKSTKSILIVLAIAELRWCSHSREHLQPQAKLKLILWRLV